MATELGAEVIRARNENVPGAILEEAKKHNITTVCMGKPHISLFKIILASNMFNELLKNLSASDIDLIILS